MERNTRLFRTIESDEADGSSLLCDSMAYENISDSRSRIAVHFNMADIHEITCAFPTGIASGLMLQQVLRERGCVFRFIVNTRVIADIKEPAHLQP